MTDKNTRDELLASAKLIADDARQSESFGEFLALVAASPFRDDEAADYVLNAVIASGTPEQLAQAYGLTQPAALALHGIAQVNIHTKQRPRKKNGVSTIEQMINEIGAKLVGGEAKPAKDGCNCMACSLKRELLAKSIPSKDGKPMMAFKFHSASEEEARALSQQVEDRIRKGESPLDVIKELGGSLMTAEEVAEAEKEGEESTQLDLSPKKGEDFITSALTKAFSDLGITAKVGKAVTLEGTKEEIKAKLGAALTDLITSKDEDRSCSDPDCVGCKLLRATQEGIAQGLFTEAELGAASLADNDFADRMVKKVVDGADPLTTIKEALAATRH